MRKISYLASYKIDFLTKYEFVIIPLLETLFIYFVFDEQCQLLLLSLFYSFENFSHQR